MALFTTRNKKFNRSNDYRKIFFERNKGFRKNGIDYHCSYCGKILKKIDVQVDHIIPVHMSRNKLSTRLFMRFVNIKGVNDYKNLTSSCQSCNLKKGKHGGGWVLSGFLGKSIWYHRFKMFMFLSVVIGALYYLKTKGML